VRLRRNTPGAPGVVGRKKLADDLYLLERNGPPGGTTSSGR
jgi:hypothetical protein